MQVRFLGGEGPLEEGMATHSSILAWSIPWTKEPGRLQSIGSHRVRHDWSNLSHLHAPGPLDGQRAPVPGTILFTIELVKRNLKWSGWGTLRSPDLSQIFLGGHNFWWKTYKKKAPDPVFPPSLSISFPPSLSNTHTDTQTQTDTYTHPWYTPPLNLEFSPSIRLGPVSSYSFPWSLPLTQPFTLNSTFSELLKHLMFIPRFCTYVFLIFLSTSFPSGSRKCTVIRTWGV